MVTRSATVGAFNWRLKTVPDAETPSNVPVMWAGIFVPVPPSVHVPVISTEEVVEPCPVTAPLVKAVGAESIIKDAAILVAPFVAVWMSQLFAVAPVAWPTIRSHSKTTITKKRKRI